MMTKPIFVTTLLILLIGLAACTSPVPASNDDILAPLSADSNDTVAASSSTDNGDPASAQPATSNGDLPSLIELISADPNLVFFTSGLNSVGLTDDLLDGGPFTVFAPSNVAFSKAELIVSQMDPALLGQILDHHLVDGTFAEADLVNVGSVVTVGGEPLAISQGEAGVKVAYAPLVTEAKLASNGTLYVIDTLLLPPESGTDKSMWGVLQTDGRFTTFISMIEGTELMGSLRFGNDADAILAPTDDAFANLTANVSAFLENDLGAMEFVISYHLLTPDGWPEDVDLTTADMLDMTEIPTQVPVSGSGFGSGFEKLPVTLTDEVLRIGDAQVITADMDATNGIVHAIDTVLIPQALQEHIP